MVQPVLYLASQSPRRSVLLRDGGIPFALVEPGHEPDGPTERSPPDVAQERASAKALGAILAAQGGEPAMLVLGVDTVVDLDGRILGKASDADEARQSLRALRGQVHRVHTGHCIVRHAPSRDPVSFTEVVTSEVIHREVADDVLEAYIASGEWRGKAGAYGIQDAGAPFVELVAGALDTVIGLHLPAVKRLVAAADGHPSEAGGA